MKRFFALICVFVLGITAVGCRPRSSDNAGDETNTATTGSTVIAGVTTLVDPDDQFSKKDEETPYDEDQVIAIRLNGTSVNASSSLVSVSGCTVTILGDGVFMFSGTLTDGRIVVNTSKDAKPQLIFDGVTVNNSEGCAVYVKQADKVFITLADGSENALSNSGDYVQVDDNNVDAVLFSKEDITLNGGGALTVTAEYGHGIVSKDDLVIGNGTYTVTAAAHGLCGKDCVKIANGTVTVRAEKDGIHAENNDDVSLGYLYIENGVFNIEAENDGLSASSLLQVEGGTFTIKTGGGSQNASSGSTGGNYPPWGYWGDTSSQDSASAKGIKASGEVLINGGTFTVDSSDDAIHCNASLTVNDGTFTISSGDDGLHADDDLLIAGGTVDIQKSYEGIEAQRVEVSGGTVSVVASDDGFNAAGGNDGSANHRPGQNPFGGNSDAALIFSGGTVHVNAAGDGLDSNGELIASGGAVYVSGPTNGGNGSLDYGGTASACGGIVVAAGSNGMAQNFGSSSTQGSILYAFSESQAAGTTVTLKDKSGTVLVSYAPEKVFQCVVITAPTLKQGETYTLCYGAEKQEITLSSLVYSNSQGGFGGGGFGGGGPRPGGFW